MSFVIKTNGTVLALYRWRLAVVILVFFISFIKICSSSIRGQSLKISITDSGLLLQKVRANIHGDLPFSQEFSCC